ncbi:prolyl oligopeptidase [Chytridium lagenaria]|nr:prolyl oligopeptidase [Chytridium lagenaria]
MKDQTPGAGSHPPRNLINDLAKRQEILDYLKEENEYCTNTHLKPNEELVGKVYGEFLARIKEDDSDVPYYRAPYWYYTTTKKGLQYSTYMDHEYIELGSVKVSPDHKTLAYSLDTAGDEKFKIFLKNLETGETVGPVAEDCGGSIVWDGLNQSFYHDVIDEAQRMYAIKRHVIGKTGEFVFIEDDKKFMVGVSKTNSGKYIIISSHSSLTSEVHYIDAEDPDGVCKLFFPRETRHKYEVEHHENRFIVLTDGGGRYLNFKLQSAPLDNTHRDQWKDIIPYEPYRHLEEVIPFKSFLAVIERSDGLRRLRLINAANPEDNRLVDFSEGVFTVNSDSMSSQSYSTDELRFTYSSFLTPKQTWSYSYGAKERKMLKQVEVPGGFDASVYTMKRVFVDIPEETIVNAPFDTPVSKQIPVTVLYKTDLFKNDGSNPGFCFVFMIAHIRGGGEMGRGWYECGKLKQKINTFTDFIAAADYVVEKGFVDRSKLVIEAGVPFVDVINTMMDDTIPLTVNEYEEWGNPNEAEYFDYMLSYSPYDNVKTGVLYPTLLVLAGLTDPRVQYWEPSKWVAKLRAVGANKNGDGQEVNRIIYNCKMGSGHFGASGRYGYLKEIAADYAFIISEILGQ